MLKKFEKLEKSELSKVTGGTIKEFEELMDAYGKERLDKMLGALIHGDYYGKRVNLIYAAAIKKLLDNDFGIDATINVGLDGSGYRETANKYALKGKHLTHREVLDMIKAA